MTLAIVFIVAIACISSVLTVYHIRCKRNYEKTRQLLRMAHKELIDEYGYAIFQVLYEGEKEVVYYIKKDKKRKYMSVEYVDDSQNKIRAYIRARELFDSHSKPGERLLSTYVCDEICDILKPFGLSLFVA